MASDETRETGWALTSFRTRHGRLGWRWRRPTRAQGGWVVVLAGTAIHLRPWPRTEPARGRRCDCPHPVTVEPDGEIHGYLTPEERVAELTDDEVAGWGGDPAEDDRRLYDAVRFPHLSYDGPTPLQRATAAERFTDDGPARSEPVTGPWDEVYEIPKGYRNLEELAETMGLPKLTSRQVVAGIAQLQGEAAEEARAFLAKNAPTGEPCGPVECPEPITAEPIVFRSQEEIIHEAVPDADASMGWRRCRGTEHAPGDGPHGWWDDHEPDATRWPCPGYTAPTEETP